MTSQITGPPRLNAALFISECALGILPTGPNPKARRPRREHLRDKRGCGRVGMPFVVSPSSSSSSNSKPGPAE
ncbi:hypothetical protein RSAG8_07691, partial [Rhizoctonia solani AG-8 WAC10335]